MMPARTFPVASPGLHRAHRGAPLRARRFAAALLGRVLLVADPAVGFAHGALRRSTPAKGAHLRAVPRDLRLTFNENAELGFSAIQLLGPDRQPIALGTLAVATGDPKTLVVPIIGPFTTGGAYTVVWRVAGADGHPVRGEFQFVVAPGATGLSDPAAPPAVTGTTGEAGGANPAQGQPVAPMQHHDPVATPSGGAFDAESPAFVAIRWLQFMGLLLVIGAVAFRFAVLRFLRRDHPEEAALPIDARRGAARVGLVGAGLVLVSALLRLYAQSYAMHGAGSALDGSLVGAMLRTTLWGWAWLLQVLGVGLAVAGFTRARRSAGGWVVAAVAAVLLATTPALSGHAAAVPDIREIAIAADTLHVIAAGGWLGSLLVLVVVGIPAAMRLVETDRGPAIASLVNAFSPTALVFAGLAGLTGAFAAWIHVGSIPALWQTGYGRTLLLKLAILSVVAGTGAYNWLRVRPTLGDVEGGRRIRRSGTVELAVGVVVLLVTAVLVATPTGEEMPMQAEMRMQPAALAGATPRVPTTAP